MGNEKRNDMRVTKSSNNSSGCDLRLNIPLCQEMCKNCIQGELTKVQIGFFKPCFSVTWDGICTHTDQLSLPLRLLITVEHTQIEGNLGSTKVQ